MSIETAKKIIQFAFDTTPFDEKVDIGFFGGEPLLHFDLIKEITSLIESQARVSDRKLELQVVTNGTVFSVEIGRFFRDHNIAFCLSCDGPPHVHDASRAFRDGRGSSPIVEKTLRKAVEILPVVLVNAVYHPGTLRFLPEVVDYLSYLGIRQIYLNPDFSALWSKQEAEMINRLYDSIGERYIDYYLQGRPHFVSLVDSKIAVILRGGYKVAERCRMGRGEFAFAPSGNIYPCERLIGADAGRDHCIGNIYSGFDWMKGCGQPTAETPLNTECQACGLKDYCMNWCGCSNYFSSGRYDRVGPFLCASERAALAMAYRVLETLQQRMGTYFLTHFAGLPTHNARLARGADNNAIEKT
jgi:uncharacterized protein